MLNKKAGRPVYGSEPKRQYRGVRLEPSLDTEFVYACRTVGISYTEGIRRGIILFIREVRNHYYTR